MREFDKTRICRTIKEKEYDKVFATLDKFREIIFTSVDICRESGLNKKRFYIIWQDILKGNYLKKHSGIYGERDIFIVNFLPE